MSKHPSLTLNEGTYKHTNTQRMRYRIIIGRACYPTVINNKINMWRIDMWHRNNKKLII